MTTRARKPKVLTLKDAFETEFARREMERRTRDEAGEAYAFAHGVGTDVRVVERIEDKKAVEL